MEIADYRNKRVWAVVGNVHNRKKFAYKIYNFLKNKGYKVYPIDPYGIDVNGDKSYTSLLDLPEIPEAVDMVINPVKGEEYIDEANKLNIKYIWFQPGAESEEIVERAKDYGMNVLYDHCVMVDL